MMAMVRRDNIYSIFLHIALVSMAVVTVILVQQNRQLRKPVLGDVAQLERGTAVENVDVLHLDNSQDVLQWTQMNQERLLFVFTTTCPACQVNQESWRTLYGRMKGQVDMVSISLDEIDATKAYRAAHSLPFEVVVPEDLNSFARAYQVSSVPLTIHVGRDGKVRGTWLGGLNEQAMTDLVAATNAQKL